MPAPPDVRARLTRRFQDAILAITDRTAPVLQKMWDDLDTYDEDTVAVFERKTGASMLAVKAVAMRQATGYYSVLTTVRPPPIAVADLAIRPDLRQPFIAYWQALAGGQPWESAVAAGRSRIEAVVSNLANSSARQTGDLFVAKTRLSVRGWERITDAEPCDWCVSVADQVYSSAESADFGHDRCGCTAAPLFN